MAAHWQLHAATVTSIREESQTCIINGDIEQSLAADGAVACFSSNFFRFSLNADRAPQLKANVGWHRFGIYKMLFLTFNSVIVSWIIVLVISVSVGILVAKTLGPHVRLSTIVTLSFLNLVAISAMIFIFIQPSKSEAQVYAYAEVASVLIIILLCLLPPTLMLWFVRLRKKR